eukprot:COSAG01_NODE_6636_length_3568_cov_5.432113_10_plen_80_part_00
MAPLQCSQPASSRMLASERNSLVVRRGSADVVVQGRRHSRVCGHEKHDNRTEGGQCAGRHHLLDRRPTAPTVEEESAAT